MLWIKRNLFLGVGGLLALGLLGVGGYYFFTNYENNNAVQEELKAAKVELTRLYALVPFPNPANIALAKAEQQRLQDAIRATQRSFSPLPYQKVKGPAFKALLETTVDELQKKADQAGVGLPVPKGYAFTFGEQQKRFQISDLSFPTITEQLAEIKAICLILFDAKINKLTGLRRGRVSSDDPPAASDYHDLSPNRNLPSGAVVSPYIVEFTSFSSELATVLEGFYKSPNGLIVKAVETKPIEEVAGGAAPMIPTMVATNALPNQPIRRLPPGVPGAPPGTRPPRPAGGAAPALGGEGMKTVLDEHLLRITLWVDVLKPLAK